MNKPEVLTEVLATSIPNHQITFVTYSVWRRQALMRDDPATCACVHLSACM